MSDAMSQKLNPNILTYVCISCLSRLCMHTQHGKHDF